jgi:non-canonical poly(A) RNA polymerase PAPD5/7
VHSDIDLVVLSDAMAYSDKSTVLHLLANTLKRNGITSHVTIIAKAKVPIVKFVTTHGRFKVDISINQGNGLVSGKIISGFLKDMFPSANGGESKALRSLVMVTKAFLSQRSMNEVYTGGLGSYSIVCLAVSFLQMHPKIRRGEIDPDKNLGVLVMEFFELYGKYFNYDEAGISLREGGMYFNKRQRGWHAEYKRNMLSIEDPADPCKLMIILSHFCSLLIAFIVQQTISLAAPIISTRSELRLQGVMGS